MSRMRQQQRGAAILMAMLIVTLVTTLATAMVWQQWRAVQIEAAERMRAQSAWVLNGALDWARLILREDYRSGGPDHLGEPWAVPLAEARLSTFLAADRENTDEAPEAFLAGSIADAQSRWNVRNLIDGEKVSETELLTFRRLCEIVQAPSALADRVAAGMLLASKAEGGDDERAPLMPVDVSQLTWLGADAATVKRLEPYVVLLPAETKINLNTAPREVIAAVAGVDMGTAERLVQSRLRSPFRRVADAQSLLPATLTLDGKRVDVRSSFFEVRGRLRLEDRVLEERSLVQRRGVEIVPLRSERVNSTDEAR